MKNLLAIPLALDKDFLEKLATNLSTNLTSWRTIITVLITAALLLGLAYVIYAFSTKKQNAMDYLLYLIGAAVVYVVFISII